MSGIVGFPNQKSGLVGQSWVMDNCRVSLSSTLSSVSGTADINDWQLTSNDNSSLFSTDSEGITVKMTGSYLIHIQVYIYSAADHYVGFSIKKKRSGTTNSLNGGVFMSPAYYGQMGSNTVVKSLLANDMVRLAYNVQSGNTCNIDNGDTHIDVTFLGF